MDLAPIIIITLQVIMLGVMLAPEIKKHLKKTKRRPVVKKKKEPAPKPDLKKVDSEGSITSSEGGGFLSRMNGVQNRSTPNDEILTPPDLAAKQIELTQIECQRFNITGDRWMDGFKNTGVFYNQFPDGVHKSYCEIIEGKDFFKTKDEYDVICGNPPFSLLSSKKKYGFRGIWETVACDHQPEIISFITGMMSVSPQLIDRMDGWGYKLVHLYQFKVQKWVQCSISIWVKTDENVSSKFTSDNHMYQWQDPSEEYHEFWKMTEQ